MIFTAVDRDVVKPLKGDFAKWQEDVANMTASYEALLVQHQALLAQLQPPVQILQPQLAQAG